MFDTFTGNNLHYIYDQNDIISEKNDIWMLHYIFQLTLQNMKQVAILDFSIYRKFKRNQIKFCCLTFTISR